MVVATRSAITAGESSTRTPWKLALLTAAAAVLAMLGGGRPLHRSLYALQIALICIAAYKRRMNAQRRFNA